MSIDFKALNKMRNIVASVSDKKMNGCTRRAVRTTSLWLVEYIKENKLTGQVLNVKTGKLRSGMTSKEKKTDGSIRFEITPTVKYGRIHELGGVIKPVRAKRLFFKVGGSFVSVSQVTIPKRSYMLSSAKETLGDMNTIFVRRLKIEIEKELNGL